MKSKMCKIKLHLMKCNYSKKLQILIFAVFLSLVSVAQTKEISVGSGVLFNSVTGNVMYRKYKPDMKSAFRYRFSLFNLRMSTNNPFKEQIENLDAISSDLKKNKYYSYGFDINVGKQHNLSKIDKFQLYRGSEFGLSSSAYVDNQIVSISYSYNNNKTQVIGAQKRVYKENIFKISHNQFIGLQYQIIPNLYLSLETMLNFSLGRYTDNNFSKLYEITDKTTEIPKYTETYKPSVSYEFRVIPTANLWIAYRFKYISK